jgi:dTDP-4-amino-4,6-dideoxygalactose transaminase
MTKVTVPYTALGEEFNIDKSEYLSAFEKVLLSGRYILGSELALLEQEFAQYCQTEYGIGVASGTDALLLVLRSLDLRLKDEVITAPNSYIASASAIALAGATPRFADICHCGNLSPEAFEAAITPNTKAVIPVHLTGRPAEMDAIIRIAKEHNIFVIEDAAQAVGASLNGRMVGGWGDAACFSFHPLKNLRAFGDGGMVVTRHKWLNDRLRQERNQGLVTRELCDYWSFNSRLDELQAAFLRVQLPKLHAQTEKRRKLALRYNELLSPYVDVPHENLGEYCVYQTYVIKAKHRDELKKYLVGQGIEVLIHYPIPIHLQPAARYLGYTEHDFPKVMHHVSQILSLPIYPNMTQQHQDYVVDKIKNFYKKNR